jgi:HD-GYP domain-containing protein (c-di-GMP phosphodiesterase class II)
MPRKGEAAILECTAPPAGMPRAAYEQLMLRLRCAGVFVVILEADGRVLHSDPEASPFFHRYVIPQLQGAALQKLLSQINSESGVALWKVIPGVTIATMPHVDRRQVQGIVLLAARGPKFSITEDVARACSRHKIERKWLSKQARDLPGYSQEALAQQARLVLSMLNDQVRLTCLQGEINSLTGELSNTYEELSLIYQLSSGMRLNRSASDFFRQACTEVMDLMNVRGMGVALSTDSPMLQAPAFYGPLNPPEGAVHRLADELIMHMRETRAPLLINQVATDNRFGWLLQHARQLLAVPLLRGNQVLGCLFGLDKNSGEFDSGDSKLLASIANESAIYLENFILFDDVRGLMMGLLHSLVSAVDAKDAYTCGHSERVALLSRLIARAARLDEALIERVYMAGLLHDVGKIGVPEAVLQKTGKLTPEEFEQIKKHPEIGARILGDIRQLQDIIPGVLHHHERYDGKGYPYGLAGESIPLLGRIICLGDCFDAMTSSRTYRRALPLEVALNELRRCAGTQFDPALTDAFLQISSDQFRELLTDHKRQTKQLIDQQQIHRAA